MTSRRHRSGRRVLHSRTAETPSYAKIASCIDMSYRVLDNYDEPIPGLYAAGATTAGRRGRNYCGSGTAVSYAVATGRFVVQTIVNG